MKTQTYVKGIRIPRLLLLRFKLSGTLQKLNKIKREVSNLGIIEKKVQKKLHRLQLIFNACVLTHTHIFEYISVEFLIVHIHDSFLIH